MKTTKFFLGLTVTLAFTACKKYEEGPSFSLRSKKARVSNVWKVEYAFDYDDNQVVTSDYFGETWEFKHDGGFVERDNGEIKKTGTWDFESDKEAIHITKSGTGTSKEIFTILKLKENEMWLKDKDEELHLISAK